MGFFFNALPGQIVTGPVKNYVNLPLLFHRAALSIEIRRNWSRLPCVKNSFKSRQGKLRGPQVGRDCQ